MGIGYLITVVLMGWCTVCALWPPRRRGLGLISYFSGFVINEVPFIAAYWLVTSTWLAFREGDVATTFGRVAFGLSVLTLVGLAVMVGRATTARGALERALADGLGPRWRAEIDPQLERELVNGASWPRVLLNPFRRRRGDVERIADLVYGDAGRLNTLDLYRHRSRPADCPVLIHFHGGRFTSGAKNRESLPLLYRLASQGWLCVSANYRLSPAASFPDFLVDAKRVVAWIRSHGREYGADPSVVFVAGDSAGGHLAATAALTPNDAAYQPGFEDVDTTVSAAICLYGFLGLTGADPLSSPRGHIHPDAPPFFVLHGDRDSVVPIGWAREFVDELHTVSRQPVVFAELPGAQHTFDNLRSIRSDLAVGRIEAFAGAGSGRPAAGRRRATAGPRGRNRADASSPSPSPSNAGGEVVSIRAGPRRSRLDCGE